MAASSIRHVNFWWLKEPGRVDHVRQLVDAANALKAIPGVREVLVGPKSATTWEGPDRTFDVGMIVTFESMDALLGYMPHPLHLKAIETSEALTRHYHAFYFDA